MHSHHASDCRCSECTRHRFDRQFFDAGRSHHDRFGAHESYGHAGAAERSGWKQRAHRDSDDERSEAEVDRFARDQKRRGTRRNAKHVREDDFTRKDDLDKNARDEREFETDKKAFAKKDAKKVRACNKDHHRKKKFCVEKTYRKSWEEDVANDEERRDLVKDNRHTAKKHHVEDDREKGYRLKRHDFVEKEHDARDLKAFKDDEENDRKKREHAHSDSERHHDERDKSASGHRAARRSKSRKDRGVSEDDKGSKHATRKKLSKAGGTTKSRGSSSRSSSRRKKDRDPFCATGSCPDSCSDSDSDSCSGSDSGCGDGKGCGGDKKWKGRGGKWSDKKDWKGDGDDDSCSSSSSSSSSSSDDDDKKKRRHRRRHSRHDKHSKGFGTNLNNSGGFGSYKARGKAYASDYDDSSSQASQSEF